MEKTDLPINNRNPGEDVPKTEALLPSENGKESFDHRPQIAGKKEFAATAADFAPGFRLRRKLGEGGMGEVFEADQTDPIRRKVAIKLIKKGMESEGILTRFENERQALALMNHPAIAQVFNSGILPDGRPYFVMEYVEGLPITRYCDDSRMKLSDRLALFQRVCEGIQHAHHRGVMHRDLKPANILVTIQDGKPAPKVIDFGIAKATGPQLTEKTFFTSLGEFMGTPDYISPEQADRGGVDIDTRSDVYSLGVVLYELVVGALPFDPKRLRQSGFQEMLKIIRDEDPPTPVHRFRSLEGDTAAAARKRSSDARSIQKEISGDLEWIIMKALEKDRQRRYNSPLDLALDIGRYLRNEPVLAGPPGVIYRTKKFVKRHRMGVLAASLSVLALIVSVIGTTLGMVRAKKAENLAVREAETSREISSFLTDLFKISDPGEVRGKVITAREILDKGLDKIKTGLKKQPDIRANLLGTMGTVYMNLGLYNTAQPLLQEALEYKKRAIPSDYPALVEGMINLGTLFLYRKDKEAESLLREAIALGERKLGPGHPILAKALGNLAIFYWIQGEYARAEPLVRTALAINEKARGPEDSETIKNQNNLALIYKAQGKYAEAEPLFLTVLEKWRKSLGSDHPYEAQCLNNLADLYRTQGKYTQARPLLEKSLRIFEKTYGPDHPLVAQSLSNMAALSFDMGNYDQAQLLHIKSMTIKEKALGPDHPDVAASLNDLGEIFSVQGKYGQAENFFRRAMAIWEKSFGPDHPILAYPLNNLAKIFSAQGNDAQAEAMLVRSLGVLEKALGPDHPDVAQVLDDMARFYEKSGRKNDAKKLDERVRKIRAKPH
jgi:non-specific serine/threonine protein kinase/serine/threonine-protein kinase